MSPVQRLISLNWMRSVVRPPKIIAPMRPLPIGSASASHFLPGRSKVMSDSRGAASSAA
jgi:hypothetical protein